MNRIRNAAGLDRKEGLSESKQPSQPAYSSRHGPASSQKRKNGKTERNQEGFCGAACHQRTSAGLESTCLNSTFAFSMWSKQNATRVCGASVRPFLYPSSLSVSTLFPFSRSVVIIAKTCSFTFQAWKDTVPELNISRSSVHSKGEMKIGGAGVITSITSLANCTSTSLDGKMVWFLLSIPQSAMLNLGHPDLSCLETGTFFENVSHHYRCFFKKKDYNCLPYSGSYAEVAGKSH